jgi:PAS domain-containing protein
MVKRVVQAVCSFSAETPVATPDGPQAISTLDDGDQVLAYNEATETTGSYTITAVLAHEDPVIIQLTIDDEQLETTPEHPFFTQDRGWVAAGELQIGEQVRTLNGTTGVVTALHAEQRTQVMYNLTVDVAHTFFVGDGQWLVHNICYESDVIRYEIRPELTPQAGSRQDAINRAWIQEQELVRQTGRGSQVWTQTETDELLRAGQVTGYTGHHINNARSQPHGPAWQGDPRNIVFLPNGRGTPANDHLYSPQGHRGSWQNSTSGRLVDRERTLQIRP